MWDVDNHSWFPHHAGFLRDHAARSLWAVAIRAAFAIRPGRPCLLADEQAPPDPGPLMDGAVLVRDGEVTPPRPACDLLIAADTVLPGEPRALTARLGGWSKTLWLHPPRRRDAEGRLRNDPARGGRVAIDAALAFGGPDHPENAAGCGMTPDAEGMTPLPCLRPDAGPGFDPERAEPCGLGPVPRAAASRQRYGGTYDDDWLRRRAPLFPADLDPRFWQAAPDDQQLPPDAVAGQVLTLSGFDPAGDLAIAIPAPVLEVSTRFAGRWTPHPARLQSVSVDLRAMRLTMLWQAVLPVGAVQNDIHVERSVIALRRAGGFSVTPAQSARLGRPIEETA